MAECSKLKFSLFSEPEKYHWQSSVTCNTEQIKGRVDDGSANLQIMDITCLLKIVLQILLSSDSNLFSS